MGGSCITLTLLSVLRGHNREILIMSSTLMTIGSGCTSFARPDNMDQIWGHSRCCGIGHRRNRDSGFDYRDHHLSRRPDRDSHGLDPGRPCLWRFCWLLRVLQRLYEQRKPITRKIVVADNTIPQSKAELTFSQPVCAQRDQNYRRNTGREAQHHRPAIIEEVIQLTGSSLPY